ncbi:MAG: hypothetical protein WCB20_09090, partial [Chthoniobacterales bacterium]
MWQAWSYTLPVQPPAAPRSCSAVLQQQQQIKTQGNQNENQRRRKEKEMDESPQNRVAEGVAG